MSKLSMYGFVKLGGATCLGVLLQRIEGSLEDWSL